MGTLLNGRHAAAIAALVFSFASLAPGTAWAANSVTPRTYYVDDSSFHACSESGPGTQALPLCTIQRAAALATVPGDVVSVSSNVVNKGEVDITASGTASAPIRFVSGPAAGYAGPAGMQVYGPTGYVFRITGASYVDISGFDIQQGTDLPAVGVFNSSHITVNGDRIQSDRETGVATARVSESTAVTLSRDQIEMTMEGYGVEIDGGSGDTVTTDDIFGIPSGIGISVQGSANPIMTSNTVYNYCGTGIDLSDTSTAASTGAVIENNVVGFPEAQTSPSVYWPCTATSGAAISLASTAEAETATENYNSVFTNGNTNATEYSWAGTTYATPAAFHTATRQGSADIDSNPDIVSQTWPAGQIDSSTSPLISSADSNAPGELATDLDGAGRSCAPSVAPTGIGSSPCYDRGAYQYTDTVTDSGFSFPPGSAPTGATLTFDAGTPISNWTGATFKYTYVFGDGTSITTTAPSATHVYSSPGRYQASVTAVSSLGGSYIAYLSLYVSAPEPPSCTDVLTTTSGLSVDAHLKLASAWTMTAASVDWGDGSSTTLDPTKDYGYASHMYAKSGLYPVICSTADAGGENGTSTVEYSTGDRYTPYGPTRLLDTRSGLGGASSQLANDGSIRLKVAGRATIPADVHAVVLNLTALNANGAGYIETNTGQNTGTSNLNYLPGGIYSNSVIAPVAADGTVRLANFAPSTSTKLDLLADISGYFAPESVSGFTPITSTRLMDTRSGLGGSKGSLAAGGKDVLTIAGADGGALPASGITAVAVNLTITGTSRGGFLTAYPDGTPTPNVSNENWSTSTTRAVAAIVPVGADGKIDLYNGSGDGGVTQVIVDMTGYFTSSSPGMYVAATPQRIFDTRSGGRVLPNSAYSFDFETNQGTDSTVPVATTAYVLNTTVTDTMGGGWLAVVNHTVVPTTSSINWTGTNQTAANLTIVPNSTDGMVDFYNGGSSTDSINVLADLMGYFVPA